MYDKVNRAAKEAYGPLNDMLAAGRGEGLAFEICSSYRDVGVQERLFQEDVDALMQQGYTYDEAYAEVARETMPPGHSEHSTGLAFDIVSLGYQMLDAGQENTAETQWLHEHCAEYGFILRYPKGKEDITEIDYESWHYRYVGVPHSLIMKDKDMCLEEYIEYLQEHPHIAVFENGVLKYEIVRQQVGDAESFSVQVTNKTRNYTMSLDNMGGVVTAFEY